MKVGLGLYRHMLTREYYDFARQAGCTHVVIHMVDYFNQGSSNPRNNQPTGSKYEPWGVAGDPDKLWSVEELKRIRQEIEGAGLSLAAVENIDPAHWYDVLLDGPQRSRQIDKVKTIIRHLGEAGNMVYDHTAPPGILPSVTSEELWRRLQRFLEDVIPVAEESGVQLAAH